MGRILERERKRLVRRLHRYGADLDEAVVAGYSQHMAEHASALTSMEMAALLASEEGQRLIRLNQALARLVHDPAGFGRCRACGADIGYERLEAVPDTELCIECKRAEEG